MIIERRKFQRSSIYLIVNFRNLKSFQQDFSQQDSSGITADFSQEGIGIESHSISYERGDILEILLKDPHSELFVSAEGEIVWRRDGWYDCKIGIKFRQITPQTKNEMLALVSSVNNIHAEPPSHDGDNRRSDVIEKNKKTDSIGQIAPAGSKIRTAKIDEAIYISAVERKIKDKDDSIIGGSKLNDKVDKKPSAKKAKTHIKKALKANSEEINFDKTFINDPQKKNRLLIVLPTVLTVCILAVAALQFDHIRKPLSFNIQTNKSVISQDIAKRKDVPFNDSDQPNVSGIKGSAEPLQVSKTPDINNASLSKENKRADRITGKGQIATTRNKSHVQEPASASQANRIARKGKTANTRNNIQPKGLVVNEDILQINNPKATIIFDYDSETINPLVYSDIKKITNALLASPKSIVKIEGYADDLGTEVHNSDLSMRRSLAVKKILIQEGIDNARIKVAASNRTVSGGMKNRRVEMLVVSANN